MFKEKNIARNGYRVRMKGSFKKARKITNISCCVNLLNMI